MERIVGKLRDVIAKLLGVPATRLLPIIGTFIAQAPVPACIGRVNMQRG